MLKELAKPIKSSALAVKLQSFLKCITCMIFNQIALNILTWCSCHSGDQNFISCTTCTIFLVDLLLFTGLIWWNFVRTTKMPLWKSMESSWDLCLDLWRHSLTLALLYRFDCQFCILGFQVVFFHFWIMGFGLFRSYFCWAAFNDDSCDFQQVTKYQIFVLMGACQKVILLELKTFDFVGDGLGVKWWWWNDVEPLLDPWFCWGLKLVGWEQFASGISGTRIVVFGEVWEEEGGCWSVGFYKTGEGVRGGEGLFFAK